MADNKVLKELLRDERRRRGERKERSERKGEKNERKGESKREERSERSERGERHERGEKSERGEKDEKEKRRREKEKRAKERGIERERSDKKEEKERSPEKERIPKVRASSRLKEKVKIQEMSNENVVEPSVEIVPVSTVEKFMFVFEDEKGTLYSDLGKANTGGELKIFPVYVSGHNENLTEEIVTYSDGKWRPSDVNKENSWLNIIHSRDPNVEVVPFNLDEVVVYNNRFFHCQDDLYDFLEDNGCEYLPVSH